MYIPSAFKEVDPNKLIQIISENAFATLVTTDDEGIPVATPLPFLIVVKDEAIRLQAHLAKNNPQWKHLGNNSKVLVIFNGPHCYISPSWYKKPGVPTWDYITVHAYGKPKLFESLAQTAELIEKLSDQYEQHQDNPWKAQGNYSERMLNAIVGFEITVQELQGKVKIGQNKSKEDLLSVIKALSGSSTTQEKAIATLIKEHLASNN